MADFNKSMTPGEGGDVEEPDTSDKLPEEKENTTQETTTAGDPHRVLDAIYALGEMKANESLPVLSLQAFQAGIFKSIACQVYLSIGGGVLGAAFFPVGLIAILLTGAELFTSDSMIMVASFLGGKIRYGSVVRNFTVAWCVNFIGALFWGGILTYYSGQLEFVDQVEFAVEFAEHKANQDWYKIFLKGIGANFLICLAVWQFTTAGTVAGKILGIWFRLQPLYFVDSTIALRTCISFRSAFGTVRTSMVSNWCLKICFQRLLAT